MFVNPKSGKPTGKLLKKSALAKQLQVNPSQITRWVRDERWTFDRKGPWPEKLLPEILRWRAENLDRESVGDIEGDASELVALRKTKLKEEIRRLRAQADTAEREQAEAMRNLLPIDEVQYVMVRTLANFRGRMLGLSAIVSPLLEGRDGGERQQIIDERVRDALTDLANGFAELIGHKTT